MVGIWKGDRRSGLWTRPLRTWRRSAPSSSGQVETRPPVRETLEKWAKALGCPAEPRLLSDENGVRRVAYGPCRDGVEFRAVTVAGLGHHWPGGRGQLKRSLAGMPSDKFRANEAIWEFFRRQRLK